MINFLVTSTGLSFEIIRFAIVLIAGQMIMFYDRFSIDFND